VAEPRSPDPQVLVVGAGPTGLLLAIELQRRDVPCLLVDALDAPRGWDRATVVHERSLEIFEVLGFADRLVAAGVKTRGARFYSDGAVLTEFMLGLTGTRYGFQVGLSEEVTEAMLTECLEAHGGSVTRSTRLVGLAIGQDAVTATLERDGGRRELVVPWVVGCDGWHSLVRQAAGIEYPGTDIEDEWAVFDAAVEGWNTDYDLVSVHMDQPTVILTPLPDRRWRIYLRPTSEDSDLVADAAQVLDAYVPGLGFVGIESPTRFHCHSRVAAAYRSGRVLLAGDAAHSCTPSEGHGMNTGIQDAFNLGWKLAMVCRGEAGAGLLDTYEPERRPVAERVAATGDAVERAQTLTDPDERARRDAEISRTFADPDVAHHEAAAASELDRRYPSSRAVAGVDGSGLTPGMLLPDTPPVQPADGEPMPLHELTHRRGQTLLVIGGPQAEPSRVGELVAELEGDVDSSVEAVVGVSIDESLAAQLGVTELTVLAVRPDRYIGLRDDSGAAGPVRDYLNGLVA
jgi:2-polyprenyl-6-methoxyphenol hydroxylase-like FAD-dependent oxidoreductase